MPCTRCWYSSPVSGLTKSPLKWGHGGVITYHCFIMRKLLIHASNSVLVWLIFVSKRVPGSIHRVSQIVLTLQWRHNGRDSVSNHQPHDCFLNRLFRHRSKKTSKLRVTGLCAGNSPEAGEFPAQMPVTREMFPFHDVIMKTADILGRHLLD